MSSKFSKAKQDALKEIATIGGGNAASAANQMLRKKVNVGVPAVNLIPVENAAEIFGRAEDLVIAVYLQLLGDVSGVILLILRRDEAKRLADLLLRRESGKSKILNELAQSSLKEAATILSGAYLNAIAQLLRMRLLVSSPCLTQDMAGAIVNNVLVETAKDSDYAIIAKTEFRIIEERVQSYFFFIPDEPSLAKIMKVLGVD